MAQEKFIEFAFNAKVLKFGEFTLKSGRISPYFFNAGLFNTGLMLSKLGKFYADKIVESDIKFDMLYGPAYKGIPLVSAISIALANYYDIDVPYAFNRKEVKDHGEGGIIIGAPLQGNVLLVDDVITAGTSVHESVEIIQAKNAKLGSVVIALNRKERGADNISAIAEIKKTLNIPVISIADFDDIISYIQASPTLSPFLPKMLQYKKLYNE